jgi:hypothetical protein
MVRQRGRHPARNEIDRAQVMEARLGCSGGNMASAAVCAADAAS